MFNPFKNVVSKHEAAARAAFKAKHPSLGVEPAKIDPKTKVSSGLLYGAENIQPRVYPQNSGGVTTSATVNINRGYTGAASIPSSSMSLVDAQRASAQLADKQIHSFGNEARQRIMNIIPGSTQPVIKIPSQAKAVGRDARLMRIQQIVGPEGY